MYLTNPQTRKNSLCKSISRCIIPTLELLCQTLNYLRIMDVINVTDFLYISERKIMCVTAQALPSPNTQFTIMAVSN